jgi:(2Fe-2S) ferredoxin
MIMNKQLTKRSILSCRGSGCNSLNARQVEETLRDLIQDLNLSDFLSIKLTGCQGFCQYGPQLIIKPDNVLYVKLKPKNIEEIVRSHLIENRVVENYLYKDPTTGNPVKNLDNILFYKKQLPILRKYCGRINPEDIND